MRQSFVSQRSTRRNGLAFAILSALMAGTYFVSTSHADERKFSAEELEFFDVEVFPILKKNCFRCHGGSAQPRRRDRERIKGHFRITSRTGLIKGGERGPAVNLTEPKKSLLLEMISYKDEDHSMPPKGKLSPEDTSTLTRWVELGAPFNPKHEIRATREEREQFDPTVVSAKTKQFWAFRPVAEVSPPEVKDGAWQKNPIDAFVYDRLHQRGLEPNPPASKRELIRRAYYDLTGLPPTIDEVLAFESDNSPDAFARVIDRLLDSVQYGEKWARHWLDLVRYAESNGYERDSVKPMAWGFRDYVIRAFHEDRPYDRFVMEQLAGDELDTPTADSMAATGFYRLGLWDDEPVDRVKARYDYLDSIASTAGEVMLGITVGCARCHDHKIDPMPQKDYYSFLSFFANISPHGKGNTNLVDVVDTAAEARVAMEKRAKAEREEKWHNDAYNIAQEFVAAARRKKPEIAAKILGPADMVDVTYRFYRDTWDKLPPFDELRAETSGKIAHGRFTLAPALRHDAMGLVFEGKLRVPRDGKYRFTVRAKDGTRFKVGKTLVGEHDGTGEHEYAGTLQLRAGFSPVRFEYFNKEGDPVLEVAWSAVSSSGTSATNGGGPEPQPLSAQHEERPGIMVPDARSGEPVEWAYTTSKPPARWNQRRFRPRDWKKGLAGFGTRGTPGAIVRTEWRTPEIWLRREFEVRGEQGQMTLWIHHDEDADVYLNGASIQQLKGQRKDYTAIQLDKKFNTYLREGRNVLAIHCRQTGGGQYIDAGLMQGEGAAQGGSRTSLPQWIAAHGEELIGKEKRDRYFHIQGDLAKSRATPIQAAKKNKKVMAVGERGRHKMHVLLRGNPKLAGEEVQPGFPSVLSPPQPKILDRGKTSGRRRALAEWVVSPDNPLSARVIVNRIWQFHFGRGIVRSSSNFGRIGDRPTHPELLDWLAKHFVRSGWRVKALHRLLMLSKTYQMSSRGRAEALAKDPQNDLMWRYNLRRLTAEEIRDSILFASGTLNRKSFGPSMYPELPPEILATSSTGAGKWGRSPKEETYRRSVYIFIRRSLQDPMLKTFDFADTDSSCAVRFSSILPTQALTMLNSRFISEHAELLAARLLREESTLATQVERGIRIVLSRPATAAEIQDGVQLVEEFQSDLGLTPKVALERFCLLLLNLNEFFFVD